MFSKMFFYKIIFSFISFRLKFSSFSLDLSIFSFIFSFLLSPLVLIFSSLFSFSSLLSVSLSLSVPVCPCLSLSIPVLLWWLLLCLVCMSLWSWCVRGVWCGEGEEGGQRDTPTPTPKHTNTHTLHTQRTTHNTEHARCHRQFCLPKFAHVRLSLDPPRG